MPIFALHSTPGSRILYPKHEADAENRHIRLISFNRPGYGGSTPLPGRRVVDDAFDKAIADYLGPDRFAVWGHSGGGAPALACAAKLPERVVAESSLAGLAPYPAEGLNPSPWLWLCHSSWFAGMAYLNVKDFRQMRCNQYEWEKRKYEERE